jgi:hypothetical protein
MHLVEGTGETKLSVDKALEAYSKAREKTLGEKPTLVEPSP